MFERKPSKSRVSMSSGLKVSDSPWPARLMSKDEHRKRGGFVPVGDLTLDLPGARLSARRKVRHFTQLDQVTQLVAARDADQDLGFMARLLALCSLPRTNPKNRHEFKRVNGPYTLYMVAGGGCLDARSRSCMRMRAGKPR